MKLSMNDLNQMLAGEEDAGKRLDKYPGRMVGFVPLSPQSLGSSQAMFCAGDSPITNPSAKVKDEVEYTINLPDPIAAEPEPENIPLDIIFEDDHLVVVNKPAGMTVHPAVGNWSGTLVHALLHHCRDSLSGIGGVLRPGIVHRIDKDTSGVLVVAKDDKTHIGLSEQFAATPPSAPIFALPVARLCHAKAALKPALPGHPSDRKKMAVVKETPDYIIERFGPQSATTKGKHAVTNYKFVRGYGQQKGGSVGSPLVSKIECKLETGRTHQIRVHLAHINCTLLGRPDLRENWRL